MRTRVIGSTDRIRAGRAALLLALALGGCRAGAEQRRTSEPAPPAAAAPEAAPASTPPTAGAPPAGEAASALTCTAEPFASDVPIAEASGAIATTLDGVATVMVIADSGHHGAYLLLDPQTGAVRERGQLPLGGPGDDLEGLAVRGDRIWALTSAGWLRAWKRRGGARPGFELVEGPSPLGPAPPSPDAVVCAPERVNCGKNFEGLCLRPDPARGAASADACVGMAASKAEGKLYCLVERGGHLQLDLARSIAVTRPNALADCYIDGETLWAGANLFDLNRVWRVERWRSPADAEVVSLGPLGVGFSEAMAVSGDVLYRFSDTQGAPSLAAKLRCAPSTK
ncbi:MAG: hypothetical protein R3B48_25295 [Kofleriaceae bacterium]